MPEGLAWQPLQRTDLHLLSRWLAMPEVSRYFTEPADPAHVEQKYGSRIAEADRAEHPGQGVVVPCLAYLGAEPIGYGQYYLLAPDELAQLELPPSFRWGGFDLFIGETRHWGRGCGTSLVLGLLTRLRACGATAAAIDVWVGNGRAVRCYEKAGLSITRRLPGRETWQGEERDHWLMSLAPLSDEAAPGGAGWRGGG